MRRQLGDRKISRRTEGPEGDFVGPQTLFAWDLHSYWMQILQSILQLFYGNEANSDKPLKNQKNLS